MFPGNAFATSGCSVGLSTSGGIELDLTPGASGVATGTVAATTDCMAGYTLYINGPTDTKLYHGGDNASEDYISAVSGTKQSPTALSTDTYGYSLGNDILPSANSFIGITNEPVVLTATEQASAVGGDTYTISYGSSVAAGKSSGSYVMANNGKIVYTVVANYAGEVTVTFDANGGTIPGGQDWEGSGASATKDIILETGDETYGNIPTPTRAGYSFLGWSLLPSEYQAVEYIQSTGTQYILTDIVPHNTMGAYLKVSSQDITSDLVYFGSKDRSNNSGNTRFWVGNDSTKFYQGWNGNTTEGKRPILTADTVFEQELNYLNSRTRTYNGTETESITQNLYSSNTFPIYIFAGNNAQNGNSVIDLKSKIKIYDFKISEGNEVTHHFIPVYRKSDGEIGLYDIIAQRFYTNDGTGTFLKGPDGSSSLTYITSSTELVKEENHTLYAVWGANPVVTFDADGGTIAASQDWTGSGSTATKTYAYDENYGTIPTPTRTGYSFLGWTTRSSGLPSGYKAVEYIESTGTQYIDTGFKPNQNTRMEVKFNASSLSADRFVFGARTTATSKAFAAYVKSDGKIYSNYRTYNTNSGYTYTANQDVTVDLNKNKFYVDGTLKTTHSSGNFTTDYNLTLFGLNTSGGVQSGFVGKIYYAKLYDNGTLIRDFIPAYRMSDGEVGLYDKVTGAFYTNQGTGTFSKGSNVDPYITSATQLISNNDHTLYADWAHNPTVTFDAEGGSIPASQDWSGSGNIVTKNYQHDAYYTSMPTPTKSGYTFLGWSETPSLPDAYQEVEYIRFSGSKTDGQYLDAGLVPTNHTTEAKMTFEDSSYSNTVFGTSQGYKYYRFAAYGNDYYWGLDNAEGGSTGTYTTGVHTLVYNGDNNAVVLDGATIGSGAAITSTTNLLIGQRDACFFTGKLYYLRVTDKSTGNVVRDFVPAYRKSDGEIGLYDTINGVFYTNLGTGSLTKGANVTVGQYVTSATQMVTNDDHTLYAVWGHNPTVTFAANGGDIPAGQDWTGSGSTATKTYDYNGYYTNMPTPTWTGHVFTGWAVDASVLPSAYQEVEYLQSTGTQYIDLPFGFDESDVIDMDASIDTSENSNGDKYMVSPKTWENNAKKRFGLAGVESPSAALGVSFGSVNTNDSKLTPLTTNDGSKYSWHYENRIFSIPDLGLTYDASSATFGGTTANLRLFYGYNANSKGKIYRYTHYKSGVKVIDLIPCYRKSDNVIGMYDIVNDVFYTNNGSGTFIKGNDASSGGGAQTITSATQMITNEDHTIYATWEEE